MSHQTKEWKRREKATRRRVKQLHRSGETQANHYLTLAIRKAKCERCPRRLLRDDEFIYRHEPRQVLCVGCATALGIKWRTSWRWEQAQGKRRPRPRAERRMPTRVSPQELLAFLVIEAGRTPKGGFTRSMTERWGVPWPPPMGWRDDLVRRWSGPPDQPDYDDDVAELDRDLDRALAGDVVTARPGTIEG